MVKKRQVSQAELPGVWKRRLLVDEFGNEDPASRVYWIQSARLCGDIRQHLMHSALADLASNSGAPLIDAFAGELIETGGLFRWVPMLSYREPNGPPDEGRLSWIDGDLREDGVHKDYREDWVRIGTACSDDFALVLSDPGGDRMSSMLRVGQFLFHARQPSSQGGAKPEFSLFELLPEGPRVVLSTAEASGAMCPSAEFADEARQTIRVSNWGQPEDDGELWHIETMEGVAAHGVVGLGLPSGGRTQS